MSNGESSKHQNSSVPWYKSLRFWLIRITVLSMLLLGTVMMFALGYIYQERLNREYVARGKAVARTAAQLLEGEAVDKYLGSLEKDGMYAETMRRLDILRIEHNVQYLYVIRVEDGGAVFVWDTDPEAPVGLGEFDPWDASYDVVAESLRRGERVEPVTLDVKWGWLLVTYEPVLRSDGSVAGYVGVDISMDELTREKNSAFLLLGILVALAIAASAAVSLYAAQRAVILPVGILVKNAESFLSGENGADDQGNMDAGLMTPPELPQENELAVLGCSITEMELRITQSIIDMKKAQADQQAMLKNILNGMEALICVSDAESFEVLFLNDSIRAHFGIEGDGSGQPCHKILQGFDLPCPSCPYTRLRKEPDKTLIWEQRDIKNNRILRKTARLIDWPDGRKAHLEYAIDITEMRKAREALEQREKILAVINKAALVLLTREKVAFEEAMNDGISLISELANIDRMSVFRNDEKPEGLYASQRYCWYRKAGGDTGTRGGFIGGLYSALAPGWEGKLAAGEQIIGQAAEVPDDSPLKLFGCVSFLVVPVFNDGRFWGFLFFEKLTADEFSLLETDVLQSAGFMLANAVLRNEDAVILMKEIEYRNHLMYTVNRISAILLQSDADTFESDLLRSMGVMAEAAGADRAYIWKNREMDGKLYCEQVYEWSEGAEPQQGKDILQGISYHDALPNWEKAFRQKHCVNGIVRELSAGEYGLLAQQGILSVLAVPIFVKEQLWGFVGFDDCHRERVFSEDEEKILRFASELIASALISRSMEKNILHLETEADKIYYDPLTGIYNRRFLDENLKRVISTLSRSGGILSVMMIDIDFFKRYNDLYGHSEGDKCLKTVAEALRNTVTRTDDFATRYGGEEFTVVLPNTHENGARIIADKLLENIRNCGIPHGQNDAADCVTVSIGIATGRVEHTLSHEDYIRLADEMLYASKQSGRNRYTFSILRGSPRIK